MTVRAARPLVVADSVSDLLLPDGAERYMSQGIL